MLNSCIYNAIFILVAVAKPLVVDGSAKSHELSLAFDQYSLSMLEPPLVLQEFVNHGMLQNLSLEVFVESDAQLRRPRFGTNLFALFQEVFSLRFILLGKL